MALVSFTLRRSVVDRGSYVRYDVDTYNTAASAGNAASVPWVYDDARDPDQYLKSNNYQIAPNEFVESFIEATSPAYGVVSLRWEMPLVDTVGVDTVATQSVLVYSPIGAPETIASGNVLTQSADVFDYEHLNLPQGQWAYYTLFVRYQNNVGTDFYEKVASIEVLVPRNYQSVNYLWERVPQYYRDLDARQGELVDPNSDYAATELGALPVGNKVGPLYKFLSIFGYEIDRLRTIIDYLMISRDPAESNTETLNAIAATVGIGYRTNYINPDRLRALLDDVGYMRRSKGTLSGTETYGRALAACDVDIDQDAREISFFAQRVNYMSDPLNATGLFEDRPAHECEETRPSINRGSYDPTTYVSGDESTYPSALDGEAYLPGMYWTAASASTFEGIPVDVGDYIVAYEKDGNIQFGVNGYGIYADNYAAFNTYTYSPYSAFADTTLTYTPNGTGVDAGVTHMLLRLNSPVPVREGDQVTFSVHSIVGTEAMRWVRLTTKSGLVIGWSDGLTQAGDSVAAQVTATDNLSELAVDGYTPAIIEVLVDLESVDSYQLKYLLAERNRIGEYFDGSYSRGGWLSNPDGNRTGDFQWSNQGDNLVGVNSGVPFQSVSVYTEDFGRTRSILGSFFKKTLPINLQDYYSIVNYNTVPGMSALDNYYNSFWKFRSASDTTATGGHATVDGYVIWTADAPTVVGTSCTAHAIISGYDRGVYNTDNNYDYISYSESYSYSSTPYADPGTDYNAAPCT